MKRILMRLLPMLGLVSLGRASIIVDGIDRGESYTLNYTANTVSMNSGQLTVEGNGGINTSLTVEGGYALLTGGNINAQITLSDGILEANTSNNLGLSGGLSATGGEIQLVNLNFNGSIILSDDAVLRFYETVQNMSGSISVENGAVAFLQEDVVLIDGGEIDEAGRIISPDSGNLRRINGQTIAYTKDAVSSIYVGVIPEPAAVTFICFAGLSLLVVRRLFGRVGALNATGNHGDPVWPPSGEHLSSFDDFAETEGAEWSRVEWKRRECGLQHIILFQVSMPRRIARQNPPAERIEYQVNESVTNLAAFRRVRYCTRAFLRQIRKNHVR